MSRLARAALGYARLLGWPVFPLWPREKSPRLRGRGYLDATTDEQQIRQWWDRYPDANIGVACDERSGLLALDVDPRHYGDEQLASLEARHGTLPETVVQLTGGGGVHHLFQHPRGGQLLGELCPGVEVKGAGYIVVAPSCHPTGREYAWEVSAHPLEQRLAKVPLWVSKRISRPESRPGAGRYSSAELSGGYLIRAFAAAGWLGEQIDADRVCVRCPWESDHTVSSPPSSTVLFAPSRPGGPGWFRCSHAHCSGRSLADVLAALPERALHWASAAGLRKRSSGNTDTEDEERWAIQQECA